MASVFWPPAVAQRNNGINGLDGLGGHGFGNYYSTMMMTQHPRVQNGFEHAKFLPKNFHNFFRVSVRLAKIVGVLYTAQNCIVHNYVVASIFLSILGEKIQLPNRFVASVTKDSRRSACAAISKHGIRQPSCEHRHLRVAEQHGRVAPVADEPQATVGVSSWRSRSASSSSFDVLWTRVQA